MLFLIIVVLCIVIVYMCMRRCHRKEDNVAPHKTTKLNTNATNEDNPLYDVIEADHLYSTINRGGSNVPITVDPSYNVPIKCYSKTSEDDYSYVQFNEFVQYSDSENNTKMDNILANQVSTANTTDPAYGVSTGDNNIANTDPAYGVSTGDNNITNTDPAYGVSTGDNNITNTDPTYGVSTGDNNITNTDPAYGVSTEDNNIANTDPAYGVSTGDNNAVNTDPAYAVM